MKYTLNIEVESAEGYHDFIPALEGVIDDIKGGIEAKEEENIKWKIDADHVR